MTIFIPQSVAQSVARNVEGNSRDYFSNILIVV